MTGQELQALRTRLGLTQEELGKKLGVRENTIWRWENEHHRIPETVAKLLEFIRKEERATQGKRKRT